MFTPGGEINMRVCSPPRVNGRTSVVSCFHLGLCCCPCWCCSCSPPGVNTARAFGLELPPCPPFPSVSSLPLCVAAPVDAACVHPWGVSATRALGLRLPPCPPFPMPVAQAYTPIRGVSPAWPPPAGVSACPPPAGVSAARCLCSPLGVNSTCAIFSAHSSSCYSCLCSPPGVNSTCAFFSAHSSDCCSCLCSPPGVNFVRT